jgi:hypothetical protein
MHGSRACRYLEQHSIQVGPEARAAAGQIDRSNDKCIDAAAAAQLEQERWVRLCARVHPHRQPACAVNPVPLCCISFVLSSPACRYASVLCSRQPCASPSQGVPGQVQAVRAPLLLAAIARVAQPAARAPAPFAAASMLRVRLRLAALPPAAVLAACQQAHS